MLKRIGFGAYGEVWMARSVTGALRAVKIVFRERFDHDRTYEREFAGLKKFEPVSRAHPGLVDILHVGRNDAAGYFFSVMELADNAEFAPELGPYAPLTLAEHVHRHKRLPVAECARVGAAVAGALAFLHEQHLIHRDVKPSNIIFVNGQPKLADIGLLAAMGEARSFVGTDGFIPPEGPGSPRGDIYGLGKTLYEMATGRSRLDFPDLPAEFATASEGPEFLELNEIILRACAESAEHRHATAEELRGELLLVDAGRSIRKMRRNERLLRIWWRIGFAACLAIAVAAAGFWWERIRADAANREARASAYQRQLIEQKERAALENLYAADMNLTQQAIEGGNYGRAAALLDLYVPADGAPDLRGFEWHYYSHILRGDSIDVLHGHSHVVSSLVLSHDGKRFFSGSFDNTIREWSIETHRELRRWTMPGCLFASISLDASEKRIAGVGGELHFGALVDLNSGEWKTNASSRNSSVAFSPDGQSILRGTNSSIFSTKGEIEILDLNYRLQRRISESGGRVFFSPNGKILVTGPWGESLKLWTWPELMPLGVLESAGVVMSASFSPDSSRLASVSQQGQICVWDVAEKRLLAHREAHGATVIWSVAFSPDGKSIATTGTDQTVRTWDAESLQEKHVYRGHASEVWAVMWSPDGSQIISAGKDTTIRVWNANPAPPLPRISGIAQRPVFSADSRLLAARLRDGSAVVWEMKNHQEILRVQDVAELGGFESDGRNLVILTRAGEIQKRRIADGTISEAWPVAGLLKNPFKRTLSPSGRWLSYGGADGELDVIDTRSGVGVRKFKGHSDTVLALSYSPDERQLLTASVDNTARIWELSTGKLLRQFGNQKMGVGSAVFSSDGGTIATGVWDDTLHVWDLNNSGDRERMILSGHEGGVQTLAISPDNRTIFALTGTGVLKFWSVPAQREAGQMRLSPGPRWGWLSISPNGEWLAVVDQTETMTLLPAPREKRPSVR
jgi:WD40 repeat protein